MFQLGCASRACFRNEILSGLTVALALETGYPLTLIGEAVFARCLSALKEERVKAAKALKGRKSKFRGDKEKFVNDFVAAWTKVMNADRFDLA